ncbi:MAG: tripartite tricarboxylate transporter substrate binding protein [Burkholderiales bacterium]|jgi:tripartite-type tricarboxylate transporter receptor subunit TctC
MTALALRRFACLALALLAVTAARPALAWPDRPIRMIVAYTAGGATDVTARAIAPFIERQLGPGARIIVENRTGAGGAIGFAALASAAPDGYTIGFINTPTVLTVPIERKVNFTWESYDLIGNVIDDPGNFAVLTSSSITNLDQLAAYARSRPGQVTVGTTGVGSDDHLAMLMFERIAKVKMVHVPFKGAADVRQATLGRQIDVAAVNIGEAQQAIKGGSPFRNLGQMSPVRTDIAPELPTFREQGYPIEMSSLRGIAAPRGLPADIRERLVTAVRRAAADPEFIRAAGAVFAPLRYLAPPEYAAVLRDADVQFRKLWGEMPWGEQ